MVNIYDFIFFNIYNTTLDNLEENKAKEIRDDVLALRNSFKSNLCTTDYNVERIRNAYMLCYFPHYINPAFILVSNIVIPILESSSKALNKICISYFAGGVDLQ